MERLTSAKGLIDDTKQSKDIATDLLGHGIDGEVNLS